MIRRAMLAMVCLAGCAAAPPPSNPPIVDPATLAPCGANLRQDLVGRSFEDLMRVEILGPVRVIRPDDLVTQDFLPNRLNIYLNATDSVARLDCG